jgi:hypothetical protein
VSECNSLPARGTIISDEINKESFLGLCLFLLKKGTSWQEKDTSQRGEGLMKKTQAITGIG